MELLWGRAESVSVGRGTCASDQRRRRSCSEARGVRPHGIGAERAEGPLQLYLREPAKARRPALRPGHDDPSGRSSCAPGRPQARAPVERGRRREGKGERSHVGHRPRRPGAARWSCPAGASGGALIARPLGGGLGALHLTLFSSPHVYVEGVAAEQWLRALNRRATCSRSGLVYARTTVDRTRRRGPPRDQSGKPWHTEAARLGRSIYPRKRGGVAQQVRALPCHGRGRGFESRRSRRSPCK